MFLLLPSEKKLYFGNFYRAFKKSKLCCYNACISHINALWTLIVLRHAYKWNIKRPTVEAVVRRCSVKNVLLKILQNSQEGTCKIDLKVNLKMNLKIDSRSVVFSCESCEIFQNTYFLEHRWTDASATPNSIGQHIYKQRWETSLSVTTEMSG